MVTGDKVASFITAHVFKVSAEVMSKTRPAVEAVSVPVLQPQLAELLLPLLQLVEQPAG